MLLLLFFIGEIGIRTYAHLFMEGKSFFREKTFICPWITSYDYPPPRMIDSQNGMFKNRKEVIAVKKAPDVIRIIAVGGSTTVNEVPFRRTGIDYSIELERLLMSRSGGKKYEVLNAGGDAYSSAQSLINIQFRILEFKPDIIILMHNINDRTVNYFSDGATGDYSNKYMQEYFMNPELLTGISLSGLLYQSRLLTRLGLPQMLAEKRSVNFKNDIEKGLFYFKRNLTHIDMICKKNNIILILLTQPHSMSGFMFDGEENHIILYNNAIREVAKKENVYFVDMYHEFGHEHELFIDPVHYSEVGITKFSQILLPHLEKITYSH